MISLRTVCVYCGSSEGTHAGYAEDAIRFSKQLAREGITLVNGGGRIGLMGIMADAILEAGGKAIGVIPTSLQEREVAHTGMTELIITPDMHSRKLRMVNLSDAFVAFPGGFGTLDEVFETLTWAQLHLHQKPILLYNGLGYFDHLIRQADSMVTEGFLSPDARTLLMSTNDTDEILPMLRSYSWHHTTKWGKTR